MVAARRMVVRSTDVHRGIRYGVRAAIRQLADLHEQVCKKQWLDADQVTVFVALTKLVAGLEEQIRSADAEREAKAYSDVSTPELRAALRAELDKADDEDRARGILPPLEAPQ